MNKYLLAFFVILAVSCFDQACCDRDTLTVNGAGAIQIVPDLARFTISAQGFGKTSLIALSEVNRILESARRVLTSFRLPAANVTTGSFYLSPQYNFTDGKTILIGQQAFQSLTVVVGSLNTNANLVGRIITDLGNINNITISGLTFQAASRDLALRQARIAAVQDARAKAQQYSSLSGRRLGKIKKIIDQNSDNFFPFFTDFNTFALKTAVLEVPYGDVRVQSNVQIVWRFA